MTRQYIKMAPKDNIRVVILGQYFKIMYLRSIKVDY